SITEGTDPTCDKSANMAKCVDTNHRIYGAYKTITESKPSTTSPQRMVFGASRITTPSGPTRSNEDPCHSNNNQYRKIAGPSQPGFRSTTPWYNTSIKSGTKPSNKF